MTAVVAVALVVAGASLAYAGYLVGSAWHTVTVATALDRQIRQHPDCDELWALAHSLGYRWSTRVDAAPDHTPTSTRGED